MGVSAAEYLGQRTDISSPDITPIPSGAILNCPFMNSPCSKLAMSNQQKPICSVRKANGTLWIVCRHRLCATKKRVPLHNHQIGILNQVAKTIFDPNVRLSEILVKREISMTVVGKCRYSADYVMQLNSQAYSIQGPRRVVLEMQGGGETSNTGDLTSHVSIWEKSPFPTNKLLSQLVPSVGTIETNAWRRQQEQFLVKGNITMQTGGGMVFCVGAALYDYLWSRVQKASIKDLRTHNWNLALIGISEDTFAPPTQGPIPLKVDTSRLLFTNYQSFVQSLTNQGSPSQDIFRGDFDVLGGGTTTLS